MSHYRKRVLAAPVIAGAITLTAAASAVALAHYRDRGTGPDHRQSGVDTITALGGPDRSLRSPATTSSTSVTAAIRAAGEGDRQATAGLGGDAFRRPPDDAVDLGGGGDLAHGGLGDDRIAAGQGDDRVTAGGGGDTVDAGPGFDRVRGRWGNDRSAAARASTCSAPAADRSLSGGLGNDRLLANGPRDGHVDAVTGRGRRPGAGPRRNARRGHLRARDRPRARRSGTRWRRTARRSECGPLTPVCRAIYIGLGALLHHHHPRPDLRGLRPLRLMRKPHRLG